MIGKWSEPPISSSSTDQVQKAFHTEPLMVRSGELPFPVLRSFLVEVNESFKIDRLFRFAHSKISVPLSSSGWSSQALLWALKSPHIMLEGDMGMTEVSKTISCPVLLAGGQ